MAVTHDFLADALAVAAGALSPAPARAAVVPGLPVWDECCSGFVWTRLIGLAPGPGQTRNRPCPGLWNLTMGVGVLRCARTVDDSGRVPSAAEITADAMAVHTDLEDIHSALKCWMPALNLDGWAPLGPDGGCAGGEWTCVGTVDLCRDCA